jgi:hypothetical protein
VIDDLLVYLCYYLPGFACAAEFLRSFALGYSVL